jgi:hypothetical protein
MIAIKFQIALSQPGEADSCPWPVGLRCCSALRLLVGAKDCSARLVTVNGSGLRSALRLLVRAKDCSANAGSVRPTQIAI